MAHWPLMALASLLILLALSYLWLQLSTPFDGSHLRPGTSAITPQGLVVTPVGPQLSSLQEGDVVIAIEGQRLESWAQALFSLGAERPQWQMGDTLSYTVIRDAQLMDVTVTLGSYPLGAVVGRTWGTILYALVFLLVAIFVYARRPDNEATRVLFLSAAALLGATTWSLGTQVGDFINGSGFWLFQLTTVAAFMLYWITLFHFALVFPSPLAITKQRWLLPLMYSAPFLTLVAYLLLREPTAQNTLAWLADWGPAANYHAALFLALALAAIIQQYRTHPSGVARQQIRWVVLAALLAGTAGLVVYFLPPLFGAPALHPNYIGLIVTVFPVAIAIAVLQHNLFDIDTLINRTLVYGALTAAVIALYIVVVGALGAVFRARGDPFVSLVAAGLTAVLFQPLRERLQGVVNRLMYGERDDPHTVLAQLGKRLEASLTADAVLPTLVETVAQVLKLPYVGLAFSDGGTQTVTSFGRSRHPPVVFPLLYQGERVGELRLEPRAPDEPFNPSELALMETIAQQAGVAVYAVRVTADLLRSRERLVSTREEERRRLRRDLHDGLGPALAGMTLKLDAAHNLLSQNPLAVEPLLVGLREQVQTLIGDLRRLVHALRPAALDLGLVAALRDQVRHYEQEGLEIALEAGTPLPPLPAAVEVAAYRIVQEALTNIVRHAKASSCRVFLSANKGQLEIIIADDGVGLPAVRQAGVGLGSMRERAAELGGQFHIAGRPGSGTRIVVHLPLGEHRG